MDIERFGRRIVELMPQLIRGFARYEHNYLSRGQITLPQLWVLEHLARQDRGCPMHRIARFLSISRPSATALVNRLIAQRLVRRTADAADRRIVNVAITSKGRRAIENIWEQKRRMIMEVYGRITPSDRAQYLNTLERVAAIISQEPPQPRRRR